METLAPSKIKVKQEKLDGNLEDSSSSPESSPEGPQASGGNSKANSETVDLEREIEQDEDMSLIKQTIRENESRRALDKRFKFCPHCHNLLQMNFVEKGLDCWRWKCRTCPYMKLIKNKHRYTVWKFADGEENEQIVELDKANAHRQRTEVLCPECNHNEAFFYQMQTRSADEPMTTFYECCSKPCRHNWRD